MLSYRKQHNMGRFVYKLKSNLFFVRKNLIVTCLNLHKFTLSRIKI